MESKTILILGGGIGGIVTANRLRQYLPRRHKIVLVERNEQHTFAASFLWLMTGDRKQEQITRPLRKMVKSGIEIIHASASHIDPDKSYVEADGQTLSYDYLVLALGAEMAPEAIPGLAEAGHTFYTLEGAVRLRDSLNTFGGGALAVVVSSMPYKCPGAPHEAAMLIADFFKRKGLRNKVSVHLFTPEPQPMPVAGPVLGAAVTQMLTAKGVTLHPQHKLSSVNPQSRELSFEGKEPFHFDLLVAIPPHRGPQLLKEAHLTNEAGWVPVNRATLETKYKNIYALGDVTAVSIPGRWKPDVPLMLPKAGVFAHAQAEVVARRIADEVNGVAAKEIFRGGGYCVLEAGGGLAGFASGNFFAEPAPQVQLRKPGKIWHLGKVLFEKWWLALPGFRQEVLGLTLRVSSRFLNVPGSL